MIILFHPPIPLHCSSGAVEDVIAKIKDGANVEIEDVNGDRPIHLAAKNGHVEVVKVLFRAGADPNSLGMYGNTPIIKVLVHNTLSICHVDASCPYVSIPRLLHSTNNVMISDPINTPTNTSNNTPTNTTHAINQSNNIPCQQLLLILTRPTTF